MRTVRVVVDEAQRVVIVQRKLTPRGERKLEEARVVAHYAHNNKNALLYYHFNQMNNNIRAAPKKTCAR
jgi:hypothetical protein